MFTVNEGWILNSDFPLMFLHYPTLPVLNSDPYRFRTSNPSQDTVDNLSS